VLNQSPRGCRGPWDNHPSLVTYYTPVPERGLFVATWWVQARGPCQRVVLRLAQDTCSECRRRHWCGRGDALHTWAHDAARATVGGLSEAHAWAVCQVRAGQVPGPLTRWLLHLARRKGW
jgi:hypothetical protein